MVLFSYADKEIIPVQQRYTKLSNTEYNLENIPNDFEAVITIHQSCIVVNYPELFFRTEGEVSF